MMKQVGRWWIKTMFKKVFDFQLFDIYFNFFSKVLGTQYHLIDNYGKQAYQDTC